MPTEGAGKMRPFAYCCSMDLITDLPMADGFDSILIVVDQGLSKGVILIFFQSTFYECMEDYFRTMCRDHVSISADLKSRHGRSIN
jgi:hypothetical protein